VDLSVASADAEILLVKWLNAIIYEMAVRSMVFSRFEVRIEGGRLEGSAWGEPVDVARHQPAVELKGATLTALSVAGPPGEGWLAQCVVDV
jgi:tRNA nucleotidyltransferase (CCA-adding enzyme)